MGKGLTKTLKDNKKSLWPIFPIRCGSFSLENFNHANQELLSLESLRLHTLPKRQFDPEKITHGITIVVKIKPFNHEANDSEDILQLAKSFEQAFDWAKKNLNPDDFEKFQEFKNQRLETIPLHLLRDDDKPTPKVTINSEGPNSRIESQVNTAQDIGKTQQIEIIAESSRRSAEKQVISDLTKDIGPEVKRSDLEQEWDQFNKMVQDTPKTKNAPEIIEYHTP